MDRAGCGLSRTCLPINPNASRTCACGGRFSV